MSAREMFAVLEDPNTDHRVRLHYFWRVYYEPTTSASCDILFSIMRRFADDTIIKFPLYTATQRADFYKMASVAFTRTPTVENAQMLSLFAKKLGREYVRSAYHLVTSKNKGQLDSIETDLLFAC